MKRALDGTARGGRGGRDRGGRGRAGDDAGAGAGAGAGADAGADAGAAMASVLTVPLSAKRIARVYAWAGTPLVDVREIYLLPDGSARPGRKGISLTAPQWRALLARGADLSAALDTLEAELAAGKAAAGTAAAASAGGQGDIDGVGDEP